MSLALLALASGGVWLYRTQESHLRLRAEDELQAIADLKVQQNAAWRSDQLGEGTELADSRFFVKGAAGWLTLPNPEASGEILSRFRSLQDHYDYADIVLVDAMERPRLSLSSRLDPLAPAAAETLALARHERKPTLGDLHLEGDHPPHLRVVAPLFSKAGDETNFVGAVMLGCDARRFLFPLIQSWPTPSRTAETLLVRRDGDSVLFLNELRHQTNTALTLRIPLSRTNLPAVMAVLGREGVVYGTDHRGQEVAASGPHEPVRQRPRRHAAGRRARTLSNEPSRG